jgi:hypothetical protein
MSQDHGLLANQSCHRSECFACHAAWLESLENAKNGACESRRKYLETAHGQPVHLSLQGFAVHVLCELTVDGFNNVIGEKMNPCRRAPCRMSGQVC